MSTVKIKTRELTGAALDWAVAEVEGGRRLQTSRKQFGEHVAVLAVPNYSADWSHGGPLIAKWQIFLSPPRDVHRSNYDEKTGRVKGVWSTYETWQATVSSRVCTTPPKIPGFPGGVGRGEGDTPLIASCRAIVAAKLGDEVAVPAALVEGAS